MGLKGRIIFNGISSEDLGVLVETHPYRPVPRRKYESVSVPGRNGDVIFWQDAYENVEQEYELSLDGIDSGLPAVAQAVADWLHSAPGYARLEDNYYPDIYRMAYFTSPQDIANRFGVWGRCEIKFSCKPQRFLKAGEESIPLSSGDILHNPTSQIALPVITILGTGAATMTVGEALGSNVIVISEIGGGIVLDSSVEDAYYGITNKNDKITLTSFPKLGEGDTAISWTGAGVTSVSIVPHWWSV